MVHGQAHITHVPIPTHAVVRVILSIDLDPFKRRQSEDVNVVERISGKHVVSAMHRYLEAGVIRCRGYTRTKFCSLRGGISRRLDQIPHVREDVIDEYVGEVVLVPVPSG